MGKQVVSINLDQDQISELKKLSQKVGIPISLIVRRLIPSASVIRAMYKNFPKQWQCPSGIKN